ncbi:peptidoglycan DD-metalloendopeptidase family protein [Catenuloplanes indicus]|uniref:Murein DD-endopeptidase MepM/ murein hydrolase activator NlpD n=1 Tax=Catenuloplanes indicus TaxID=137267 RepID=A0AAE3VZ86_9ACTN|nr:peptidoglycan DD-metalloendopeptidase family protein [Catenuloplanes indicus]MDQ0366713.1 murein DD-endopeptidase MepM/ murein hydrolase activator NlpD [Catenuloplanes indicus]
MAAPVRAAAHVAPERGPATVAARSAADPRDDQRRIEREVAKAAAILEGATDRARAAARSLAAASAGLPPAQARAEQARGRVAAAQAAADTAKRKADTARAAQDAATNRSAQAERDVSAARDKLGDLAAASFKGGNIGTLNVLIDANPTTFADRLGYVDRVLDTQRGALTRVVNARGAARDAQNAATTARRAADAAHADAATKLADARTAQRVAEDAVAAVQSLTDQRRAALGIAQQERSASLARYRDARAAESRVAAEVRAWENRRRAARRGATNGGGSTRMRSDARLLMPVRGWKSSNFGWRFDPYYKVWQLHTGVDIAAGGGQPIWAADDGEVIRAGWANGYGNFTCVAHGDLAGQGVSTCYGHQSRILVHRGQRVRRGQLIGRVGTTGASTGYHLHFEVRLDGTPKQPLNWLPSCLC